MEEGNVCEIKKKLTLYRIDRTGTPDFDMTLDAINYLVLSQGWEIHDPNERLFERIDHMIEYQRATPSNPTRKQRNQRVRMRLRRYLSDAGIAFPDSPSDWLALASAISETDIPARDWDQAFREVDE
jgi:hypothetical protein